MGLVVKGEGMSNEIEVLADEQAADLARLRAAAAEGEPVAMDEPEAAPGPDPVQETAAMLGAVVALASPLLPYLPSIYTPETVQALAGAYVPVAEKYGWSAGGWLDKYGAEVALIAVAGPVLVRTSQAHQQWKAEREREAQQARGELIEHRPAVVAGTVPPEAVQAGPASVEFGTVAA